MPDVNGEMDLQDARDDIGRAIQKYYELVNPNQGEYVEAWIVLTERTSFTLQQESKTVVGVLSKKEQSFVTTRGLLDIALQNEKMPRAS